MQRDVAGAVGAEEQVEISGIWPEVIGVIRCRQARVVAPERAIPVAFGELCWHRHRSAAGAAHTETGAVRVARARETEVGEPRQLIAAVLPVVVRGGQLSGFGEG